MDLQFHMKMTNKSEMSCIVWVIGKLFLTPLPFGCHLRSLDRVHPGNRNM